MSETPDWTNEPEWPSEPTPLFPTPTVTFLPDSNEIELVFMQMPMDPSDSRARFRVTTRLTIDDFESL